jgi:hypothetical protein
MNRSDLALVVVGGTCGVVWLVIALPDDVWRTLAGTVLGGGILAGLISLAWRWWREEQEVRLLRAFQELFRWRLEGTRGRI